MNTQEANTHTIKLCASSITNCAEKRNKPQAYSSKHV